MKVLLDEQQAEYLLGNLLGDRVDLIKQLNTHKEDGRVVIELSEETADEIRDLAGEKLQEAGFDENYEPTNEGKKLEHLIDLFFCD